MESGDRCDDGGVSTTVLIVDDHADFRGFARTLLEVAGFEVVGEACDGASALLAIRELRPELVLLDVQLPDMDGFAVCEELAARSSSISDRVDVDAGCLVVSPAARSEQRERVHREGRAVRAAACDVRQLGVDRIVRLLRLALLPVGVVLGLAAEWVSYGSGELDLAVADLAVGWVLLGCGLVAWERRGRSLVGPLLAAAGVAWFLGSFWTEALYLHRGPLVHALLVYPSSRVTRPLGRAVVAAAYLDGALEPLGRSAVVTVVLCVAIVIAAIDGYLGELGPRRRARVVSTAGAAAVALVLTFGAVGQLAGWDVEAQTLWLYEVVLIVVALALLGDLLGGRWSQGAVTGLVVDLGDLREPGSLRARLARALGDSSLEIGWWLGPERGYAGEAGEPFAIPGAGAGRAVTPIDSDGDRVAVLVHDRAVLDDPALVDAVAAATRIAFGNVRLQADVRARVEQLAASRRRIVEAADEQRRRLERQLHDGAERRLTEMASHVDALAHGVTEPRAQARLADVETQLGAARTDLSELARGIHPSTLTTGGLAAALAELARRASVPVELIVDAARFPAAVEAAAYFVCAEALTNVTKYACASQARIEAHGQQGLLIVEVVDDGVGGADAARGSGLRGLGDRVEALGGRFTVESRPGTGTRLLAQIPAP